VFINDDQRRLARRLQGVWPAVYRLFVLASDDLS
jgi:hypothetical protein